MIDPADYRAYYGVVANQTLWFCLHGLWDLPRRPRFDRHWWAAWERFRQVNEQFAAAAAEAAAPGATVLVQDYQLALVPAPPRRAPTRSAHGGLRPHAVVLAAGAGGPARRRWPTEILSGLAGAGACGFHSGALGGRLLRLLPGTPGAGPERRSCPRPPPTWTTSGPWPRPKSAPASWPASRRPSATAG